MRKIFPLIFFTLLIGLGGYHLYRTIIPDEDEVRDLVIHVLQTVPRSFLVLETHHTIVVAHRNRSSWLLGTRRGQSSINVRIHGGVDAKKVTPADIRVDGRNVRIRLPAPEVLDVAPDIASWRYTGKRSGLWVVGDAVRGTSLEEDLLKDIERGIRRYASNYRFDRDTMIARINRQSSELFAGTGLSVLFE